MRIERESDDAFTLIYREGIKVRTRFALEPAGAGSRLAITDDYALPALAEREQRLDEVDRSLTAWGWALHEYYWVESAR